MNYVCCLYGCLGFEVQFQELLYIARGIGQRWECPVANAHDITWPTNSVSRKYMYMWTDEWKLKTWVEIHWLLMILLGTGFLFSFILYNRQWFCFNSSYLVKYMLLITSHLKWCWTMHPLQVLLECCSNKEGMFWIVKSNYFLHSWLDLW